MSDLFISFMMFAMVATITPGGATTLATASGVQFGFVRSIPLLFGIAAGLGGLSAIAASGLGALIQSVPTLSFGLKLAGSVYLLWLAWKISSTGGPQTDGASKRRPLNFVAGMALLVLNPKAWAMTLGAAASFAGLSSNPLILAVTMAVTFSLSAVGSLSLWCVSGSALANALRTERHWRIMNVTLAMLLAISVFQLWS